MGDPSRWVGQLVKEKQPHLAMGVAMIPPVIIEDLMDEEIRFILHGGHDVPSTP
jgi:hypothetical protein